MQEMLFFHLPPIPSPGLAFKSSARKGVGGGAGVWGWGGLVVLKEVKKNQTNSKRCLILNHEDFSILRTKPGLGQMISLI